MKGLLLGTDYIKTNDGNLKVIETNTNVVFATDDVNKLNWDGLKSFIQSNNFTTVHLIANKTTINFNVVFQEMVETELGLNYVFNETSVDSITVPYIEDGEDIFILRISYDTTAIIDDEYCKDMYSFLRAIKDLEYNPKTYIPGMYDDFAELVEFSYNGDTPNFIIKSRLPNYDKNILPKLYKITTLEQLNELKATLTDDSNFLQEFVRCETINNKSNIIRGIDIVYGGNLDVISMGGFKTLHEISENIWENTYDETGLLAKKDRAKYITYFRSMAGRFDYIFDVDQEILMSDGSTKTFANLNENDMIKSISLSQLPLDESTYDTNTWTASHTEFLSDFAASETTVVVKITSPLVSDIFIKITLDDETTWDDLPRTQILVKEPDTDVIRFKIVNNLQIGDVLELFSTETETIVNKTITNLEIIFKEDQIIGSMDTEPVDLFLPLVANTYAIIQHNGCLMPFCGVGVPQCYSYPKCPTCTNQQCNTKL
jgi:hypothetical protein